MLTNAQVLSFIPTALPEQARRFYTETLGLELTHEDPFGMSFRSPGGNVRLSNTHGPFTPQPFSVIGWQVSDIAAEIKSLQGKGVIFERYETLEQDDLGIWTTPDGKARIAWFKDPDGNVLSLIG